MDAADRAQLVEDAEREASIDRARHQNSPDSQGGKICVRCGEDIEPLRLRFMPSARTCFHCQTELEQRDGLL